jgi:hypothetical protein
LDLASALEKMKELVKDLEDEMKSVFTKINEIERD